MQKFGNDIINSLKALFCFFRLRYTSADFVAMRETKLHVNLIPGGCLLFLQTYCTLINFYTKAKRFRMEDLCIPAKGIWL